MIVVDSDILAYLHLPGVYTAQAASLLETDSEWVAPILWRSELRNVLTGHMRRGGLGVEEARRLQWEAEDLMSGAEYDVDSGSVLELAARSGCSAYDCEYVALARQLALKLVTMDQEVLRAFPEVAIPLTGASSLPPE